MALLLSVSASAFAAEYDLSQGSITIEASGSKEAGNYVQKVIHGDNSPVKDDAPVIIQGSSGSTDNTITISTTGGAETDLTIRDINISDVYGKSAIDVGDSRATIHVEGQNTIEVDYDDSPSGESGSTALVHVSGGDLTITSETGGKLELENQFSHGAVIGSNADEDFSGSIHITGNVNLVAGTTTDIADGAGIGSGEDGNMTGTITIDGSAEVEAAAQDEGAGIGSGENGEMSGDIIISGNAKVTAISDDDGAGIGSGEDGEMSGTIIIGENAKVTAYCNDDGAGIGSGENAIMSGRIHIKDKATVYSGNYWGAGTAIGSDNSNDMNGQILILDEAVITTGWIDSDESFIPNSDGIIGDGNANHHDSAYGIYVFGDGITINGISGSNIEGLKNNVNMYLDGEQNDGEVVNLAVLSVTWNEDGTCSAEVTGGAGQVEKVLYGSGETVPAAPGSYPVIVVLTIHGETVEIEIGTLVIPAGQTEALYRVTDSDGIDIPHRAERADGVLTITVDAEYAVLTGKLSGIETLKGQGIEKLVFITNSAASAFQTSALLENGSSGDEYKLTHDSESVTFILGEKKMDVSDILIER